MRRAGAQQKEATVDERCVGELQSGGIGRVVDGERVTGGARQAACQVAQHRCHE